MKDTVRGPYKGLVPYTEEDYPYFFGRGQLRRTIAANLKSVPLTALYGPSGVGKSSLLMAGVVHDLNEASKTNLEERGRIGHMAVPFRRWQGDYRQGLAAELEARAQTLQSATGKTGTFEEVAGAWIEKGYGRLLLILDQFEEFYMYHPSGEEQIGFGRLLANLIDQGARVLLSLREDQLSLLERLRPALPAIFSNQLRVDHLDEAGAREAIEKPPEEWNKREGGNWTVDPRLTDAVIAQLAPEAMKRQAAAVGIGTGGTGSSAQIQAPWLQIVMSRLWTEEVKTQTLKVETLNRLKGVLAIAERHLSDEMSGLTFREKIAAAILFQKLVTPSGTKILYPKKDLIQGSGWLRSAKESVLTKLSGGGRILEPIEAGEPRYQIYHDQLGPAILGWRQQFVTNTVAVGVLTAAINVLAILALLALPRYFSAQTQTQDVTVGASALASLDRKDLSLDVRRNLAIYALAGTGGNPVLQQKAERALADVGIARFGFTRLWGVAFSPNASYIALAGIGDAVWLMHRDSSRKIDQSYDVRLLKTGSTFAVAMQSQVLAVGSVDGIVRLYDPQTGELKHELKGHTRPVLHVAVNENESMVASTEGLDLRLWGIHSGKELATLASGLSYSIAFHPKQPLLAVGLNGEINLFRVPSGVLMKKEERPGSVDVIRYSETGQEISGGSNGRIGWVSNGVQYSHPVVGLALLTRGVMVGLENGDLILGPKNENVKAPIASMDSSSGGTLAATVDREATFRIWDELLRNIVTMPTANLKPVSFDNGILRMIGTKGMVVDWNLAASTAHIELNSPQTPEPAKVPYVRALGGLVVVLPRDLRELAPAECSQYLGVPQCPPRPSLE